MRRVVLIFLVLFVFPMGMLAGHTKYAEYLLLDPEKRISMDFEKADLVDVLKIFSQQSGLNFICSEAIKNRKITVYFDKVPLKEAFQSLLLANNLTYEFFPDSNIFMVKELGKPEMELETKIYHLKYARVSNSRLQQDIDNYISEEGDTGDTETSTAETSTTETGGATGYTTLKNAIENILSPDGHITEDPRTNSIIVTDYPSRFGMIEKIINNLDIPTPKVLIEVEILDVNKNLLDRLGFKYGAGGSPEIFRLSGAIKGVNFPFTSGGGFKTPFFGRAFDAHDTTSLTPGSLSFANFQVALEALSTSTDAKFLARPRILTLSNETAEIRITRDEAVGVRTTESEAGNLSYELERQETGISLRVTPQVNPLTGQITMFIVPRVAEAISTEYNIGGFPVKDPEERTSKSILTVNDGETVVISGLIRNKDEETITKVPLLGDIPLLGALFRHKDKNKKQRELVVFITPHIIDDSKNIKLSSLPVREQLYPSQKGKIIEEYLGKFER